MLVAAALLLVLACGHRHGQRLAVVTTLPDLADWARNVGGERVEVTSLLSGGEEPHNYEPRPADVQTLARARVLMEVGLGLEEWLDGVVQNAGNARLKKLTVADGVRVLHDEDEEAHAGHSHAHGNPHVWLDPMVAKDAVRRLAELLSEVDSAGGPRYRQRAEAYCRELDSATAVLQQVARSAAGRKVVTVHESWPYFCARFGFEVAAAIEPLPGQEPSARHLAGLALMMKAESVRVVVVEPHHSRDLADALAREAGAEVVVLASVAGALPGTETYLGLLDYDVRALAAALSR